MRMGVQLPGLTQNLPHQADVYLAIFCVSPASTYLVDENIKRGVDGASLAVGH